MSKLTLSFKGKVLKVFPVREGELVIGSDPGCDVYIDSLAIQSRHSRIATRDGKSRLADLGSSDGTFVNDKRIDGEYELADDDEIRIGKHHLLFTREVEQQRPGAPDASIFGTDGTRAASKNGWLQILSGQNVGKTLSLNKSMVNLGKPGVQTAVIVRRNDGYFISHLEGEHAPLVNGEDIGEHSWRLSDGDVIQMGNVKLQFYLQ